MCKAPLLDERIILLLQSWIQCLAGFILNAALIFIGFNRTRNVMRGTVTRITKLYLRVKLLVCL
jgi:hypothetical protein